MRINSKTCAWLGILLMASWVISCSTERPTVIEQQNLVWPSPPAQAKIRFVSLFSKPIDLGIERGFLQWIGDLFAGEETYRLVRPMSIVVTDSLKIYVADPGAKGVHRFDLKARKYQLITRQDDLILTSPVALCLGPDNSVYVVDSELAQVFQIGDSADHAQRVLSSITFQQPTGIAYHTRLKRIYISDTALHQIKVINEKGILETTIGKRGSNEGEFNFPTYLWLDTRDKLLVTDSLNFRIQIFNTEGQYINTFGQQGDASGNLARPKGVAADKYGHIYVVDALHNAIQIFNEEGNLLLPVGSQGHKAGEFWLPAGIFLTNNGEIYVADSHNQRVQILRYIEDSK